MKRIIRLLVTILMVMTVALTSVTPAFAEEPPPPPPVEDPGGGAPQNDLDQPAAPRAEGEPPGDAPATSVDSFDPNYASMPNYAPNGAATSGMGVFQGEQLINSAGNPLDDGANLEAMSAGTAYACPPGKLPAALYPGGTCVSTGYSTVQAAVAAASSGWTVWLSPNFDGVSLLTIDKALTIQGDPFAQPYLGTVGATTAISIQSANVTLRNVFSRGNIEVGAYGGVLRLQDVVVESPLYYGLLVEGYSGSVILSQVNVTGSLYGSYVDASGGTGTVTVVNSVFDRTQTWWDQNLSGYGIHIIANNTVKLENVSASENQLDGLFVEYAKGLSIKNGTFNYNYEGDHDPASRAYTNIGNGYGNGIYALDSGVASSAVLLQNVSTRYNDEDGVHMESPGAITITNSTFYHNSFLGLSVEAGRGTATLTGVNVEYNFEGAHLVILGAGNITSSMFNYNYGDGLIVDSLGVVNLNQVRGYYNDGAGVKVYNNYTATTQGVNVTGGYFDSNNYEGLFIRSRGNVILNGVTVTKNNWWGAVAGIDIDNCQYDGMYCTGTGNVTFANSMGVNTVSNNYGNALTVETGGNFTATSLYVNDNAAFGVYINTTLGRGNTGNVTITNSSMNQNGQPYSSTWESANGLVVFSRGSINLDKVQVNTNTEWGMYLANYFVNGKPVTLKNVTVMDNWSYGVEIDSRGVVTINHLTAISNNNSGIGYGLDIDNASYGSTVSVNIQNTLGDNMISKNGNGVKIFSYGSVTIQGLDASENSQNGFSVNNAGGVGAVSISNSKFNDNGTYGLDVISAGNITLNNVQANGNNGGDGASLYNTFLPGKTVTVNKGTFNNNDHYGLTITAGGAVTVNAIQANDNRNSTGLWIRNDFWGAYNVNVLSSLGANQFNNNAWDGLYILTNGNVVVSKANANNNGGDGFYIHFTGVAGKKITFTCSSASYNWNNLWIQNTGSPVSVYLNGTGLTGGIDASWGTNDATKVVFIVNRTNCP
jgi:hypothetical protein